MTSITAPNSLADIQAIIQKANALHTPIIPIGANTNRVDATVSLSEPSIFLTSSKLNRILDLDVANRVIVVEPGVVTADIHRAVEAVDLFYPPDPASMNLCTIGGNVAMNAGALMV